MKKSIIASVVALGLVSGMAQAGEKEIQFVGSVTAVTCDIDPSVDGSTSIMPGVTVSLTWTGDKFTTDGLGSISGTATDAHVQITALNAKSQGDFIKASATTHEFAPSHLKTGGKGLQYKAVLKGGSVAGDFQTAAKFNLTYK